MDAESMGRLAEVVTKEPNALTDEDKAILLARRSYLTEEQRSIFAAVLDDEAQSPADEPASEEGQGSKKGKK